MLELCLFLGQDAGSYRTSRTAEDPVFQKLAPRMAIKTSDGV